MPRCEPFGAMERTLSHAASFGRSEALKDPRPREGGEEWLQRWSRTGTLAPYATNFHVTEAPLPMQWKAPAHKAP